VLYERDVDFNIQNEDGFIRFLTDPFREYVDPDGVYLPKQGMIWRTVDIQVGNQFRDMEREYDWRLDSDVKTGDVLRLLAQMTAIYVDDAGANPGQVFYVPGTYRFYTAYDFITLSTAQPGDVIQVYGSGSVYDGYYVIKGVPGPLYPGYVELEETFHAPLVTSPPASLNWKLLKMSYFDQFSEDYIIDYIDSLYLVGNKDTAFPLDLTAPLVYSVVRNVADPEVVGVPVSPIVPTYLGYTHIIPGTLVVSALKNAGGHVEENVDYSVNYLTGWLYPLVSGDWNPVSINTCKFYYQTELVKSAGGDVNERTEGAVKQLAFWVPEAQVDKFNLFYHYGYLLNRFEVSSEAYKTFLRGIMHLYMHGPIFSRMVSGMNIVAGYPVVRYDQELLSGYFNGINAKSDSTSVPPLDGEIVGAAKTFTTTAATWTFTELDVGGYMVFPSPVSAFNEGKFKILSLVDSQTVLLESAYPMVDELNLEWILSRDYEKVVYTDKNTYKYPLFVPMRADIEDPANIGNMYVNAFDALTEAFTVTDYVEAPTWWVGKTIPYSLFPTASLFRRMASDNLFAHVVDPLDLAAFDDPGLYFDADEEGHVADPTVGTVYRHGVGFVLFDQYLKYHMFHVEIDPDLELPANFKSDFEDVVLAIKPTYTYPYVESEDPFLDEGVLWDIFTFHPKLYWGDQESIIQADNELAFDAESDLSFDDYFTYTDYSTVALPFTVPVGPFVLPIVAGEHLLVVNINSTVGGDPVMEGVDYTVCYDPTDALYGTVTPLTVWDDLAPAFVTFDASCAAIINASLGAPDTRLGYTPLMVNGWDPAYVRESMASLSYQTENVERPVSLYIDTGVPPFYYVYP
jgi:hypothetical protein